MRAAALSLLTAVVSGCTWNSSQPRFAGSSPAPLHVQITTSPAPDGNGLVPRNAVIQIVLDDYPDPDTAHFGPIQLRSGANTFDIAVTVDLVDKTIVVTPRSLLAPNGSYVMTVAAGVAALDGRVVTADATAAINVSLDDGTSTPPPATPTWTQDIAPILGTCAPACHSPIGAAGDKRTPTRLLDLTGDPTNPTYGLINVPAQGELGWPEPLLRVSPGDSARSALLRKLIGGDPLSDSHDPPYPDLRVDGRRMPIALDETQSLPPLNTNTLRLIQRWIDGGAPIQ